MKVNPTEVQKQTLETAKNSLTEIARILTLNGIDPLYVVEAWLYQFKLNFLKDGNLDFLKNHIENFKEIKAKDKNIMLMAIENNLDKTNDDDKEQIALMIKLLDEI